MINIIYISKNKRQAFVPVSRKQIFHVHLLHRIFCSIWFCLIPNRPNHCHRYHYSWSMSSKSPGIPTIWMNQMSVWIGEYIIMNELNTCSLFVHRLNEHRKWQHFPFFTSLLKGVLTISVTIGMYACQRWNVIRGYAMR